MKFRLIVPAALAAAFSLPVLAQSSHAVVVVPDSSVEHSGDKGVRAHTNHLLLVHPDAAPNATGGPGGETPSTIYPVYLGTSFNSTTTNAGSQTIAIVDAYHYATAENDLGVFSNAVGLPACTKANGCFSQVYANGTQPSGNCGWNQEAALDIEWAHAMSPKARIVLVEAASSSFADLFAAVNVATQQVTAGGGKGEVSMSWGGSEFSGESSNDGYFQHSNVVYFGSSGDTGGATEYPSASQFVVAAGGTTLNRNSNGSFKSETGWSGSGGGPSKYEAEPVWQDHAGGQASSTRRSIPDFSFDADPYTGVSVYDSTRCQNYVGWQVFGGTSVASPSLAAIVNRAGSFASSSTAELTKIYSSFENSSSSSQDFYDVTSGTAGGNTAAPGYDFVTGVGSNRGTGGK